MQFFKQLILSILLGSTFISTKAQINLNSADIAIDYSNPKEYTLGGIEIVGAKAYDKEVLIILSGLRLGEKIDIPSEKLSKSVQNFWKQGLFGDVNLYLTKVEGEYAFLTFEIQEKPRISRFGFSKNVKKSDVDNINEKIKGYKSRIYTQSVKLNIQNVVREYFVDKGYWDVTSIVEEVPDTVANNMAAIRITINQGEKLKIGKINFHGNTAIADNKLKKQLKDTKEKKLINILKSSKFLEAKFEEDKDNVIAKYQELGYRDAKISRDTIYKINPTRFGIDIYVDEGSQYYFGDITFTGNSVYPDSSLSKLVGIKRGDVYNQTVLDNRLFMDPNGRDITSLYMDDGYLFFQLVPVEINVENDTINLEVRIYEGAQATINKVTLIGNDKTNDHVVLRELRTRPGMKFSRADIIRTQRELSQLGYFDPEQMGVVPTPNPIDGTVDIEYKVAERSNDQIELSGGWGANQIVGSLGLVLNNFSAKKMFKAKEWSPVPSGDGQRLSLRAQSSGFFFQSYNASFTEPWLGGNKPNAFSVSLFSTIQSLNGLPKSNPNRNSFTTNGVSISLGKRLQKPDDFFTILHSINFNQYNSQGSSGILGSLLPQGITNDFHFREVLARNSIDAPIFSTRGSSISLSTQFTLPYSLLMPNYNSDLGSANRSSFIEYHKWRFDANWFTPLVGKLVLSTAVKFGFLGSYTGNSDQLPFGRFQMGGDGIMGFNLIAVELFGLRGYNNNSITPRGDDGSLLGGTAFQKFTMELRYPISLNPSATVYATTFLEAGNTFRSIKGFDPFSNFRSAGAGVRVFLPMFGLLGLDWGYGFDTVPWAPGANRGQIHVSIGQQF